jgi:hypothetical protein
VVGCCWTRQKAYAVVGVNILSALVVKPRAYAVELRAEIFIWRTSASHLSPVPSPPSITPAVSLCPLAAPFHDASPMPIALREPVPPCATPPPPATPMPNLRNLAASRDSQRRRLGLPSPQARHPPERTRPYISLRSLASVQAGGQGSLRWPDNPIRKQCVPQNQDQDAAHLDAQRRLKELLFRHSQEEDKATSHD